jgi:hypothetical protein
MTGKINCECGKLASNAVIVKGSMVNLWQQHIQELETQLGQEIEPLTRIKINYNF